MPYYRILAIYIYGIESNIISQHDIIWYSWALCARKHCRISTKYQWCVYRLDFSYRNCLRSIPVLPRPALSFRSPLTLQCDPQPWYLPTVSAAVDQGQGETLHLRQSQQCQWSDVSFHWYIQTFPNILTSWYLGFSGGDWLHGISVLPRPTGPLWPSSTLQYGP